jgi:hypothetical protein
MKRHRPSTEQASLAMAYAAPSLLSLPQVSIVAVLQVLPACEIVSASSCCKNLVALTLKHDQLLFSRCPGTHAVIDTLAQGDAR